MNHYPYLHCKIIGKGQPLILLHGFGWHSGIWNPLIDKLTDKFQLFLIDLPGFGKSPVISEHYSIKEIAEILVANTPPHAYWLGWSLGGMIAWHIAIHYPQQIAKLITVASSPKFVSSENWPGVALKTLNNFGEALEKNYQQTLLDFLELQLRGAPRNEALRNELVQQIHPEYANHIGLRNGLEILRTLDLRDQISNVQCPSLHVFGGNDTLVPVKVANLIEPLLMNGTCLTLARAGHIPFLTQNNFLELCGLAGESPPLKMEG